MMMDLAGRWRRGDYWWCSLWSRWCHNWSSWQQERANRRRSRWSDRWHHREEGEGEEEEEAQKKEETEEEEGDADLETEPQDDEKTAETEEEDNLDIAEVTGDEEGEINIPSKVIDLQWAVGALVVIVAGGYCFFRRNRDGYTEITP